jgi:hypothetical protein
MLAAALCAASAPTAGLARQIAIGPPSFQADASRSYDTELLNRLASGQYEPEDLSRLAWLTVLQSLAMQSDVERALAGSPTGNQLDAEIITLRNAADSLYEDFRSSDTSAANQRLLFDQVQVAYRQLQSTLGEFPGLSNRAAMRLEQVGQLLDATNHLMGVVEASQPGPTAAPSNQALDLVTLKRQSRLAANALVVLIDKTTDAELRLAAGDDALPELDELWTLLHDFNRSLAFEPAYASVVGDLHAIRRQAERIESMTLRPGWPPDLREGWRAAHAYIKAMSDEFGMPRTLELSTPPRSQPHPRGEPAPGTATRIYRGSP